MPRKSTAKIKRVSKSVATIDAISDKELVTIFNSLPTNDFMALQRVCKRWKTIHDIVCRSKRELFFYCPNYRLRNPPEMPGLVYWSQGVSTACVINPDDQISLILPTNLKRTFHFQVRKTQQLTRKFPNVRSLNLYGTDIRVNNILYMFKQWPNIVRLTLAFDPYESPTKDGWRDKEWNKFWKQLERLPHLKHLALSLDIPEHIHDLLYKNMLSRLESLYISVNYAVSLHKIFSNVGPQLSRLSLANISDFDDDELLDEKMTQLLIAKPHLATQFTQLGFHFDMYGGDELLLELLSKYFTSVTHLDLNLEYTVKLDDLASTLVKFGQLTSLRLTPEDDIGFGFKDDASQYDPSDDESFEPNLPERRYEYLYDDYYEDMRAAGFFYGLTKKTFADKLNIKLDTVRTLHLVNFDFFRWELFDYLHAVFPKIEEIHFDNCEFPLKRRRRARRQTRRLMLLRALRRFLSLKRIHRNGRLLLDVTKIKRGQQNHVADQIIKELFKTRPRHRKDDSLDYNDYYSDFFDDYDDDDLDDLGFDYGFDDFWGGVDDFEMDEDMWE